MDDYTIGVEEEYQLVDAETGALRSAARTVLATDWSGDIKREFQETAVEIGTRVCADSAAALEELRRLRFQAATAAGAHGLRIVAAGLHPSSRWEGHRVTDDDRYRTIAALYGRLARDEHKYGMHVHVAVETGIDRARLMNAVRHCTPHIVALSASSPFFEGGDTQYSSFRTVLWRRWPNAGVPPRFVSEHEYHAYVRMLIDAGALLDEYSMYWSLRPHASYPTLELRMPDVCPRADDARAIAGLARVAVAAAVEGTLPEDPWPTLSHDLTTTLLSGNEWRAARGGLSADLVDPVHGRTPMRRAIDDLLQALAATAGALGEEAAFDGVRAIVERGNGADLMRAAAEEQGGVETVTEWLAAETLVGTGLDRREGQRLAPAGERVE